MKATFNVGTLFKCENIEELKYQYEHDLMWRQTVLGCNVLRILQDMFKFNISYVRIDTSLYEDNEIPLSNRSVDIYVRPMELKEEYLDIAYPIHAIFQWRFGFLLRYKYYNALQTFYSLPFTTHVWVCIIWILVLSTLVFYLLSYWEKRLIGGDCCIHHEFLLAFSAYCQHILPLQTNLCSRRIAYLIFILSAYIIHCFYTSNLLSHLVNDKDREMDLKDLAYNDYEFVIIKDMNLITERRVQQVSTDKYLSIVERKLRNIVIMNVTSAVEAVRDTKTAVLTDYITLYPIVKKIFDNYAICELIEVNLYSNVKKYFFTSKTFPLKEDFKIGILRAQESGLIARMVVCDKLSYFCDGVIDQEQASLSIIYTPMVILFGSFIVAILILIGEKIHYDRYHLWPYTD